MKFTQEDIYRTGFSLPAAPVDDWRVYDEDHPVPNYFDFDWLSSRHPDLYHRFALSTLSEMNELSKLVDLTGMQVIDIGAGTGRSSIEAAKQAQSVTAVDAYESVVNYGRQMAAQAGLSNLTYLRGDAGNLPFAEDAFDACLNSWAVLSYPEAWRVLKPGGTLIVLGAASGALCGELTATLADVYPHLITEVAPDEVYDTACPPATELLEGDVWNGLPVHTPVIRHDFTGLCDYGDIQEAAAIYGRLYGPKAKRYLLERKQCTFAWRLRIEVARVRKS